MLRTAMLRALLHDEGGFIISTELVLVSTLLVIGLVVGQATMRDQVVTELADAADAISTLDQSYMFVEFDAPGIGSVAGSTFADAADFCDENDNGVQGLAGGGTCVLIDGGNDAEGSQTTVGTDTAN